MSRRQRVTAKASGSRGWYDSPEWRARSRAQLEAHPDCINISICGRRATISDHDPPVRPDDREGVLRGPIRSMCWPCHAAKSRREQGDAGRLSKVHKPLIKGADINGVPLDPEHPWRRETIPPKTKVLGVSASAHTGVSSRGGSWRNGA